MAASRSNRDSNGTPERIAPAAKAAKAAEAASLDILQILPIMAGRRVESASIGCVHRTSTENSNCATDQQNSKEPQIQFHLKNTKEDNNTHRLVKLNYISVTFPLKFFKKNDNVCLTMECLDLCIT